VLIYFLQIKSHDYHKIDELIVIHSLFVLVSLVFLFRSYIPSHNSMIRDITVDQSRQESQRTERTSDNNAQVEGEKDPKLIKIDKSDEEKLVTDEHRETFK
jgi:hypothetical protein